MAVKKLIDLPPIDIYYISAVGFYRNLVQPNTIAFITSLYEIDKLIEEKEALAYDQFKEVKFTNEELVNQKLPEWYWEFKDIFSKTASDTFPLYQPYNHKIKIKLDKES